MASLKSAVFISVGEKYIVFFIQFLSSIALARILSPSEVGIFSIGSLILSLSHALRDLGISNYIIQEKDLSRDRLQAAQTLMMIVSWLLAVVAWVASWWVADFYDEPGVGMVLRVLSLNFVLLPLGSISMAMLKRSMRFDSLLRINTAATLAQAGVSVGACMLGSGFIGLAWGGVAGTFVTVGLALWMGASGMTFRPALKEWRHVLSVGGRFSGASILWELGLSSPEIVVGRVVSLEAAGFLGRAQGVVGLVYRSLMEGLAPVLMPHFAKSHRDGEDLFEHYLKSVRYLSVLTIPIFTCLAVAMDAIVLLLYGDQWGNAVEPARILCVGMAAMSMAVVTGAVVAGMGESKYTLTFQLVGQPLKIILIVMGAFLSLNHVAGAMVTGDLLITFYSLWVLRRLLKFSLRTVLIAVLPSVVIALLSGFACLAAKWVSSELSALGVVVSCMVASMLAWGLGLRLMRHPLGDEIVLMFKQRLAARS
ncbi:lipopolysaccharide biosynthesis protein [Zoogloea sp.]|uniref:lipopolysaccharide biosynthesis protein n=1 Tax=Zoogloea sp. TaxID=49181 RepID=UPI001415E3F7|nr:MAG: lipopolysaccharide biosynthesis protein [Zoogloea sp.]